MTKPEAAAILEPIEDEIIKNSAKCQIQIQINAMCIIYPGWIYNEWEDNTIAEFVIAGLAL